MSRGVQSTHDRAADAQECDTCHMIELSRTHCGHRRWEKVFRNFLFRRSSDRLPGWLAGRRRANGALRRAGLSGPLLVKREAGQPPVHEN